MGVQGLTKLVNTMGVFEDLLFGGERLVIDGSSLVFHLCCHDTDLDLRLGGEYGAFKDVVTCFFETLDQCSIQPYVVFDGCPDFSDQKWKAHIQRTEHRVEKGHQALQTGRSTANAPTLIWEVFRQTLSERGVPMARCYTEADQQVAALAQEWGCPVLSSDSDFFIFPLTVGMLHIAHFRWREVKQQGDGRSLLPCKRYHTSSFCEAAGIGPQLLPAFAVLAGNDYTGSTEKISFYHKLVETLSWIRDLGDVPPQTVFTEYLDGLPALTREQRMRIVTEAAHHYILPPSSLRDYFDKGILPLLPRQMKEVVPDWMRRPVTEARFSSDFLDVLTNQRVGLSVVVDHKDKPSANQVSLPLRRVLYGLLLGDGAVVERDRDGPAVKTATVQTVSTNISLQSLPEMALQRRKQVLLEALEVTEERLSPLPPHLDHLALPLAATCFWLKRVRPLPGHSDQILRALLICWCRDEPFRQNAGLMQDLDLFWWKDILNMLNQWQSCLRDCFLLNQLLGTPLPEPQIAELYNGALIHDVLHKLERGHPDPEPQSRTRDRDFNALLSIAQDSKLSSPFRNQHCPIPPTDEA